MKKMKTAFLALFAFAVCFGQQTIINGQTARIDDDFKKPAKETKISKQESLKKLKSPLAVFSEKKNKIKGLAKYDSPDKFNEFQRMIRTRDGESSPGYKIGYQKTELDKALQSQPLGKIAPLNWEERGPGNVSGRTRGIVIDPRDRNTWLAGSVGGGIWKTTDAGYTWTNKAVNMPNLATTVLAQSASSPNIIYCGTGEGFYNADAVNGGGIFKSTDNGDNWTLLAGTTTTNFNNINRIIIDPANPEIVLAATNDGPAGIWRSTDGGTVWNRVFSGSNRVQDLRATPGNFSIQYAAVNGNGIYKSTDGGITWNAAKIGLPGGSRYEICVSPKNTQVLFASIETDTTSVMAYSNNGAASWSTVNVASGTMPDWLDGQGWYDNTIEAHPYNANIAFMGGVDLWKTELTGGQSSTFGIQGIDLINTSWLYWVDWGAPYNNGSIGKSIDFYNSAFASYEPAFSSSQLSNNYVSVEVRFGPDKSQKANVFYRQAGDNWLYKGYVTVPFEVWDVSNNRQLMISFRDGNDNGAFDLNAWDYGNPNQDGKYNCREYIFIHDKLYDPANPAAEIAVNNGVVNKMLYAIWAELPVGATWNPVTPASTIKINCGTTFIKYASITLVTDGYRAYGKPYVHVDHHSINIVPINEASNSFWIVNGNDGGVSLSTDAGTTWSGNSAFIDRSNGGYNTTQFYGVDKKPGADEYMGGTQDNGTWKSSGISTGPGSFYTQTIGGDGFDVAWHHTNPNKIIGGYQYNGFYRTTDGGASWISATNGLDDVGSGSGCFISKIAENNSDPDVIYTTGKSGVWKSEDFGGSWNKTVIPGWSYSGTSTPVAISIAEPQNVWAGTRLSNSYNYLWVSTDGGLSFTQVSPLTQTMGGITGIDTHPTEPNTAYVTFSYSGSPKIFKTTNLGSTWSDISGFSNGQSTKGFPDVATYCVLVMPFNLNQIWAGTEIGLIESLDGGASWHLAANGIPAVNIWKMKIVDDQVVVATHGRGIYTVTLPQLAGFPPPAVTLSPTIISATQSFTGTVNVQANLRSAYDSTKVYINGVSSFRSVNTAPGTTLYSFSSAQTGSVIVQVISYKQGRVYKSVSKTLNLLSFKPVQDSYSNNLNSATTDFSGADFTIEKPAGFGSKAIHSLHPYASQKDYYYTLLVPIRVAASNAFFDYDDIAIVEPGEPNSVFGDSDFYDYVVVEASKDGNTWIPIDNGYDCRFDIKWTNIFNATGTPDSTYYVHHRVNLLNKFAAGDQILIRFHLYSDPAVVGWGWSIDNISIQPGAVAIEKDKSALPINFALMQNYPNPFNPSTNIKFQLPAAEHVKLEIYDSIGRLIETLVDAKLEAGFYNYKWNAKGYASGVYIYRITAGTFRESKKLNLLK